MVPFYLILLLSLPWCSSAHNFTIHRTFTPDNSLANGASIALLSATKGLYLDASFTATISDLSQTPHFFQINTWGLPQKYNISAQISSGPIQLQSLSTGLWAMAYNGGGATVKAPSRKPWGWETFVYEKESTETILLRFGDNYFRMKGNEVVADEKNRSLAERFVIKRITERLEPDIFGVNLGGWLVVEKLISPKLFHGLKNSNSNASSEDELCSSVGPVLCEEMLRKHYETFINPEKDLEEIKEKGLNLVRIPIGYWATKAKNNNNNNTNLSLEYLDKAMSVCDRIGLAVIVDLHKVRWTKKDTDDWEATVKDTIDSLIFLTKRYTERPSFFGIELVNEPSIEIPLEKLQEFYYRSYSEIREIDKNVVIVMSDSFRGHAIEATKFIPKLSPNVTRVMIDLHNYQCFSPLDKSLSTEQHLKKVEGEWLDMVTALARYNLVLTGEWSLGLDWHTYEGLLPEEIKTFKSIYFLTQRNIFQAGDGCCFWTWRLENPDTSWDMERLFNEGYIIPS